MRHAAKPLSDTNNLVMPRIGHSVKSAQKPSRAGSLARRERFPARRHGSGRLTTRRKFELVGRRTGIVAKENVRKDIDGFDDVDDFWNIEGQHATASAGKSPVRRRTAIEDSTPKWRSKTSERRKPDRPKGSTTKSQSKQTPISQTSTVRNSSLASSEAAHEKLSEPQVESSSPENDVQPRTLFSEKSAAEIRRTPTHVAILSSNTGDIAAVDEVDAPAFEQDESEEVTILSDADKLDDRTEAVHVQTKRRRPKSSKRERQPQKATVVVQRNDDSGVMEKTPVHKGGTRRGRPKGQKIPSSRTVNQGTTYLQHSVYSSKKAIRETTPTDDDTSGRRSGRQRFKPMAFWKNERPLFERDDRDQVGVQLPTIKGILEASATPVPPKRKKIQPNEGKKKRRRVVESELASELAQGTTTKPLSTSRLPKGVKYKATDNTVALCWNEASMINEETEIFARGKFLQSNQLPITADRPSGSDVVAAASQAFNTPEFGGLFPGWISGHVDLPPHGIKDAEGVGLCTQVFYVVSSQPKAFEVAIAVPQPSSTAFDPAIASRFLLSAGDHFYIPPNNVYRLENHSLTASVRLSFTIIKPMSQEEDEANGD